MIRLTITVDEQQRRSLEREARRRRVSVSEIVRSALDDRFQPTAQTRKLPFAALGRSGKRHTGRDAEKILAREWSDARRR